MNIEQSFSKENIGEARKELLALEEEGKYVFHGTMVDLDILKPFQAFNKNKETGLMEKDGDPAVFATPYVDIAIFRALMDQDGMKEESTTEFWVENDKVYLEASENVLKHSKDIIAKVYVLNRNDFPGFEEGMQCRSEVALKPIKVIDVKFEDLSGNIEIIDL